MLPVSGAVENTNVWLTTFKAFANTKRLPLSLQMPLRLLVVLFFTFIWHLTVTTCNWLYNEISIYHHKAEAQEVPLVLINNFQIFPFFKKTNSWCSKSAASYSVDPNGRKKMCFKMNPRECGHGLRSRMPVKSRRRDLNSRVKVISVFRSHASNIDCPITHDAPGCLKFQVPVYSVNEGEYWFGLNELCVVIHSWEYCPPPTSTSPTPTRAWPIQCELIRRENEG